VLTGAVLPWPILRMHLFSHSAVRSSHVFTLVRGRYVGHSTRAIWLRKN
jgi:hypothetical protein